eukprot:TRINITY_DN8884_c0_g1_i4.p1 TRINITY_DN8884_c0_g1~~TRINITY_DN8884_c0_g1_i4.p1  ORF type:complete len:249 (-),score=48.99 TRINITY_DN8884_c0_g1_i4:131-784(-)
MKSEDKMKTIDLERKRYKNSESLPKSSREYSRDNGGSLMIESQEVLSGCKSYYINSVASLNPIIEDPSKEDVHSSESNGRCKNLSINPFITNEELKTPTTIDHTIIKVPSATRTLEVAGDMKSGERRTREELKDINVLDETTCGELCRDGQKLGATRSAENNPVTLNLKEKGGEVKRRTKLKAVLTIHNKHRESIKLEGERKSCCRCDNSKPICTIV